MLRPHLLLLCPGPHCLNILMHPSPASEPCSAGKASFPSPTVLLYLPSSAACSQPSGSMEVGSTQWRGSKCWLHCNTQMGTTPGLCSIHIQQPPLPLPAVAWPQRDPAHLRTQCSSTRMPADCCHRTGVTFGLHPIVMLAHSALKAIIGTSSSPLMHMTRCSFGLGPVWWWKTQDCAVGMLGASM